MYTINLDCQSVITCKNTSHCQVRKVCKPANHSSSFKKIISTQILKINNKVLASLKKLMIILPNKVADKVKLKCS